MRFKIGDHVLTPTLDAFAKESLVFQNAVSTSSVYSLKPDLGNGVTTYLFPFWRNMEILCQRKMMFA